MERKLKFDLDIETNALLCPNPNEFYSRAYLTADVADTYRALPGIKSRTKLGNVTFGSILQASTCAFTAPNDSLNAIDIDVCAFSAMAQICQFDLEQSFVALQMTQGSNGDFSVPSFMNYYWGEMAKQIEEDIELIRWQGDITSENALLALCDGYLTRLCKDGASLAYTSGGAINASNVLTTFGMPDNTIVASLKDDLIYAFDAEGDSKALKAVNLTDSVAEPYIRTRANVKAGFYYTNPEQIAVWADCFD